MGTAINSALRHWAGRVRVPFIYTLSTGLAAGSWTVDIPNFIDPRWMRPQIKTDAFTEAYWVTGTGDTWVNLPDYDIEPDGSGGSTLRIRGRQYSSDVRIIHWQIPGPLPIDESSTSPVVLLDSSTSMTVTSSENNLPECGFIKVNSEWIQYSGLADAGTTLTLSNLVRGVAGTTEATHDPDDTVDWGIGVDRLDMIDQLLHQCRALLHAQYLAYASPQEREQHTFTTRWEQQLADEMLKNYVSSFEPIMRIDLS